MSDLTLICMPPADVAKIWPGEVHDLIDLGFASADMPMPSDLTDQLAAGTRLLWLVVLPTGKVIAAMLTQLFEMRSGRICKMMECGGSRLDDWKEMRSQIESYAKAEGCVRVLVEGRIGWARVLDDYRITSVVLEKRI